MVIKNLGFTLIELLICIVIMAVISQGTYELMSGTMTSNEVITERTERLHELESAFRIIDLDFTQMVPRHTRFTGNTNQSVIYEGANLFGSQGKGISFTRMGALNPGAMLPRSENVRVWYRITNDKKLERATYPFADTIINYEPKFETLLSEVYEWKVLYFNNGLWVEKWNDSKNVPKGVKILIRTSDYGDIEREIQIIAGGINK